MQRNWIGRSRGAEIDFVVPELNEKITVFTTKPDTLSGATYLVLAPEHPLVSKCATDKQRKEVEAYCTQTARKTNLQRTDLAKEKTGVFTGSFALHPTSKEKLPIWVADYVIMDYGGGAIMAVPHGDTRDMEFAQKFSLPVKKITPLSAKIGKPKVSYKLRDWLISRQRYWGEPFPIYYENGIAHLLDENELPLLLPQVESYKPAGAAKSPLSGITEWVNFAPGKTRETDTMPGYAGSSWYFYRYMDVDNNGEFASKAKIDYWQDVDFYIGGTEHAVGHLLYSRMWNKFLYDLNFVPKDEPYKRLVNQGMIQGVSKIVYRVSGTNLFVTKSQKQNYEVTELRVDTKLVKDDMLDIEKFKTWRADFRDAEFILEDGKYFCGSEAEKMSKSKHNTVNPDDVINEYGADCFRMYEMFLGPLDAGKPWDTKGITGVQGFLRKLWRLFIDENGNVRVNNETPNAAELKILHKTIKKAGEDIEKLSFNTAVSTFMICVNELQAAKCYKREVLEKLLIVIAPFAPFITEELWEKCGYTTSIHQTNWPQFDGTYLTESNFSYPVSINGKVRANIELPLDMEEAEIKNTVLALDAVVKWTEGKEPKKVIIVKGRIVNVVL